MREGKRGSGSGGGGRRVKHNLVFVLHNCLCVIPWNPSIVLLAAAEEMEPKIMSHHYLLHYHFYETKNQTIQVAAFISLLSFFLSSFISLHLLKTVSKKKQKKLLVPNWQIRTLFNVISIHSLLRHFTKYILTFLLKK